MKLKPILTHGLLFVTGAVFVTAGVSYQHQMAPTPSPVAVVSATPSLLATPTYTMDRDEIVRKINEERLAAKVPTLYYDNTIQDFADTRLKQVRETDESTGKCSHDGFTMSKLPTQLHRNMGENIACTVVSTPEVMRLWNESPTHKAAMLDGQYSQITVSTDGKYAVVLFSTRAYAE